MSGMEKQLPQGWEVKTLGEIGKVSMCKRIFKKQTSSSGEIPFYKIGTFGKIPNAFISKELYEAYRQKYSFPKKGDILLSASGTIGRRVIYDGEPAYFQDSNIVWIDNDEQKILNEYLYLFYGFCNWNPSKGATISRLYNNDLRKIRISYPKSLQEQQKIVTLLDEVFEQIERAKANIERNIVNAKELYASKFEKLFLEKDDSWRKLTLLELIDKNWIISHLDGNHGGNYPRKSEFVEKGIPYISAKCISDGEVNFLKAKYLTKKRASQLRKGIAINNDVLFAHNATVGPTALLNTEENKVILGTSLTYYRCNTEYILPTYLLAYMRSKEFIRQYEAVMRQSTRNQVPITKQRTFYHIIPPLYIQDKIVPLMEQINEASKKIIQAYSQKLTNLEELKKSLLEKAFNGELTNSEKTRNDMDMSPL